MSLNTSVVKAALAKKNLSLSDLAVATSINEALLTKWLATNERPTPGQLSALSRILDVSASALTTGATALAENEVLRIIGPTSDTFTPAVLAKLTEALKHLAEVPTLFKYRPTGTSVIARLTPAEQGSLLQEASPALQAIATDLQHQLGDTQTLRVMHLVYVLERMGVQFLPVPQDSLFSKQFAAAAVYVKQTGVCWLLLDGTTEPTVEQLLEAYAHFLDKGEMATGAAYQFSHNLVPAVLGLYEQEASKLPARFTDSFPAHWLSFSGYRALAQFQVQEGGRLPTFLAKALGLSEPEGAGLSQLLWNS